MSILSRALSKRVRNDVDLANPPAWFVELMGEKTSSGQVVTTENSRTVSTAYRCGNIISDDVAKMPLQVYQKSGDQIRQVAPDARMRNLAYLLEVSPNAYQWTPFMFKKNVMLWLIYWGNAYVWTPPGFPRQMFILPSNVTEPVFDAAGSLWFKTTIANETKYLPMVEVLHLMINPDQTGMVGRSVITYAREAIGRQMGAHETQGKFYSQGLNPGGLLYVNGELNKEARGKVREAYMESMGGADNAYSLAVFDSKITKFEPITMKPVDVQFLEGISSTDLEIANFFGLPLYKLNMGKQSYASNEQQNLDYLSTTLDPYLVQWEQAGRLKWVPETEHGNTYLKFNRDSLLRTDAKTRADYLRTKIESGQMTPNEARAIEDMSGYALGNEYYMPANMMRVGGDQNGQ
jgi:HK97 family phage portal protein